MSALRSGRLCWQAHRFCGRCGAEQAPIEAGAKRQCRADPRHRVYPRTDPVVRPLRSRAEMRKAEMRESSHASAQRLKVLKQGVGLHLDALQSRLTVVYRGFMCAAGVAWRA